MKNHFVNSVLLQEIFRFSLHFKTAVIPHSAPFSEKSTSEMSSRERQTPLFAFPGRLPFFVPYFLRYFDKIKYIRQFFGMVIRLHFPRQTRLSLSFFPAVFIIFEIDSPLFLISRFLLPPTLRSFIRLCRPFCPQKRQRLLLPALLSARKTLLSACKIRSAVRQAARPEMSAKKSTGKAHALFSLQLFTGTYGSMRCLSVI